MVAQPMNFVLKMNVIYIYIYIMKDFLGVLNDGVLVGAVRRAAMREHAL